MKEISTYLTSENFILKITSFGKKCCTQMGAGYEFLASVRDGVSAQRAFRAKMTSFVLVVVLLAKAP
jgi:hypothetical protein